MCGIAGVVSTDSGLRAVRAVRAMTDAIAHRGPDDEGFAEASVATIGARRLAIIDVAGGHQPMTDESGRIFAVQNGEIYNFLELRQELEARGHRFRTRNDTEVLPHAYEEWGPDLVLRVRGMFALAVWDDRSRTLLLARDRFGKKPLVYADLGDAFLFASEIQGVLAHPLVRRDVDEEAIADYLVHGYVPPPRTAFALIRKVPPAHVLVHHGARTEVRRYWTLSFTPKLDISTEEAADELRERIDEAVRVRMMSDVPIGVFLSGGLDSSTVVASMARHSERPVKTFSIGFRDQAFDELGYARVTAQAYGTEHHEFVVDSTETDVLPKLVRHLGEPFADSSIVPTYHVARITRSAVTVALNGDGGDELFAGYDRYKAAALAQLTAKLPAPLLRSVANVAGVMPAGPAVPHVVRRGIRFLRAMALPPIERHARWLGYFTGPLWHMVAGERLRNVRNGHEPLGLLGEATVLMGAVDPAERFIASDVLLNLPGDLLVKMDIATMANSLEARSPLLDYKLAEFVARLPASYKLSLRTSKVLLRRAMRGILPPAILTRGKMGFTAPVGSWLRGPLRERFSETVLSRAAAERGYIDVAGVRRLFDEHIVGREDRTPLLWNLLILELWFSECVDDVRRRAVAPN